MFILALLSSALTIILLLPYSLHVTHAVVNVVDPLFYAWNLSHNAATAFSGISAMLNANIFYPLTNTIAYSDTLWAQSILTSPIIWVTHNPVFAENVAVLISFPLSAISFFLLAHYFTRNTLASAVGGLFYAFSYTRLAQIGHLPMVTSQWLPLYFLSLFTFLTTGRRRDFALLAVWYVLSLTSSLYFGVLLIPVTILVLVIDLIQKIKTHTLGVYKNRILAILPIIVPFIIVVGIAVFPYIRLKVEYPEIRRNLDDVTDLRAAPIDYISVLPTSLIAARILPTNTNEHVLFPTLAVILLALTGIVLSTKKERFFIYTFGGIALLSAILSLGNEQSFAIGNISTGSLTLPYSWLYHLSPLFQTIRVPARFSIFVILSLSVLSAYGINHLVKRKKTLIVYAAVLLFFVEIWQVHTGFTPVPASDAMPPVYAWLSSQQEPMILAETPVSVFYNGTKMENQLHRSYSELSRQDTYALETYRMYFSTFHKKRMINGYSGFLPDSYNKLTATLENFPSEYSIGVLRKLGVTHAVIHLWQYTDTQRSDITKTLESMPFLTLVYSDEHDRVYVIDKR